MKKPIFWRDRMILVVEAKREAKAQRQHMIDSMNSQLGLGG